MAEARKKMSVRRFGKVAVLLGGKSAEREISLMSGRNVLEGLRKAGVDAHPFDPAEREFSELKHEGFERAFIALHGRYGEDGTVQGALELLGIPYTGSGVMASALSLDKLRTKLIWFASDLPTPHHEVITSDSDWTALAGQLGLPLIIKPAHEGSTLGLTKVLTANELPTAYQHAARYDQLVLAEEFVEGEELTAGFVGEQALPLIRIEAPQGNYDYQNKYFSHETKYICPCGLPPAEERRIQELVMRSAWVLGCSGWGRVDLMLNRQGRPFVLEVNTVPGMTATSLVPEMAAHAGMDFGALVRWLVEDASCNR